jgi:hypothetical protein
MPRKHTMPAFLDGRVTAEACEHWLSRKAAAHCRRDRHRGRTVSRSQLKEAIHGAVLASEGLDVYTGELLDWHLLSKFRNEDAKAGRHAHKASFALLPTVDHVRAGDTEAAFRICAWRTTDAKGDLSPEDFIKLCTRVLKHSGHTVTKRSSSKRKRRISS